MTPAADTEHVSASYAAPRPSWPWIHLGRLGFVAVAMTGVGAADGVWKAAVLAGGRRAAALDAPASALRPSLTLVVGLMALAFALSLPWRFVPGSVLVAAGTSSNLVSLGLWRAVPNPIAVHVAGGVLAFNLADVCVTGGGVVFAAAFLWTLWRMPDPSTAPTA